VQTNDSTGGVPGTTTITAGNAQTATQAGGAVTISTGTGNTSGAGGLLTLSSGAGGNAAAGGAINITVGAATGANGASVTVTAGSGNGGTNGGGNINFIPGAAVATGIPGEVQINSAAGLFSCNYISPLPTTVVPASGTSQRFFIAERAYRIKKAYASVVTHGTSETFDITKDTSGTAPGGGTSVLAAVLTTAVANTPVTQNASATIANATLAAGDSLGFKTGGTIGSAAGLQINVLMVPC
jgi:hypothetical protein